MKTKLVCGAGYVTDATCLGKRQWKDVSSVPRKNWQTVRSESRRESRL